jgi:pheromone shutdown protein TraB
MTDAPTGTPRPEDVAADPSGDGQVTVVGTAHVSADSVSEVEATIAERHPDVVAVELDEGRYRQLKGETPEDLAAGDLLRGNTVYQFLAYWLLSYVQMRLGERFDIEPGADMLAAVETAEDLGLGVALVDRDIQMTVQRFWRRMRLREKASLLVAILAESGPPLSVGLSVGAFVGLLVGIVVEAAFGPVFLAGSLAPSLGTGAGAGSTTLGALALFAVGGVVLGFVLEELASVFAMPRIDPRTQLAPALPTGLVARPLALLAVYALGGLVIGAAAELAVGPFVFPGGAWAATVAGLTGSATGNLGGLLLGGLDGLLVVLALTVAIGMPVGLALGLARPEQEVEEIDLDELTDGDVVTAMLEEFRRFSPGGAEALIDERDAFIAHRLVALREAGYDVVAVVGAGHEAGIERYLDRPDALPPVDSLVGEATGGWTAVAYKAVGYLFTVGFLAFFVLLAMAGVRQQQLLGLLGAWFLVNGIIAMTLARVAGAHWSSASVGGAVAWLTSVNPLLAPGWFAGYVELRYLDVNVSDISTLNTILADEEAPMEDLLRRMREVPLFRLILIVAMTNIGSMIASFLFAATVLPAFSADVGGVDGVARLMLEGARESASLIWRVVT